MKLLKILLIIFWLIPPLIITDLLLPAIIPTIFLTSKTKSPDDKYTVIVQDEQYGPSFSPASYTVDIKFRAAKIHYMKARIFEADDGLRHEPEVTWVDSKHLHIKMHLKDKNAVILQMVKYQDIVITYDLTFDKQ